MKAMALTTHGDPEVLTETTREDPTPGPDTVVVRTHAAGVNPVDWKIVAGYLQGAFPHFPPVVPGWDVAGVVVAVGPAVQELAEGDEVIGYVRHDHIAANGTYAELVGAHPRHLARKPASLSFEQAAALPLAGLTALQSLRLAGVGAGDTVLVHGAAGGVGAFAVQLAVHAGATVIGTASEVNHGFLRDLGAIPVAYGEGLQDRVREAGTPTASVDYVGSDEAFAVSAALVGDAARIVSNVDPGKVAEVGGRYAFVRPQSEDLAHLGALAESGVVVAHVQEAIPLAEAARALRTAWRGTCAASSS